jgi:hypothetical protein
MHTCAHSLYTKYVLVHVQYLCVEPKHPSQAAELGKHLHQQEYPGGWLILLCNTNKVSTCHTDNSGLHAELELPRNKGQRSLSQMLR